MKKLILPLFILIAFLAKAGENGISFHIGPSIPIGVYASIDNNNSGFAKTGVFAELTFDHNFSTHWGLELKSMGIVHSKDITALENAFGSGVAVTADNYSLGNYVIGPKYIFPFSKSSLQLHFLMGIMAKAEDKITVSVPGISITQTNAAGSGFSACFGITYELNLSDKFGIDFNYDSVASSITYNETATNPLTGGVGTTSFEQKFNFINIGAGVHYRF